MKLLTRTVRNYVLYSALLLIVCTPIFYFSIQRLFLHRIDQELVAHKKEFYELIPLLQTKNDIEFFGLVNEELILKETASPLKKDSLITASIYSEEEKEMHPYRILRTNVTLAGKHYELQIQESMVNTSELISAIVAVQAILITLLLAGFVFINRKLSKTVWQPFYNILERLKKYQIDKDSSIDLPPSSTAEFRDLSLAISQLVERNHRVFQSQKEFTENAAHELQTPLAVCRTQLELLVQTKELTQEQAELVGNLLDVTDRITRQNKDLLLLSKIENRQFLEREEIKPGTVIKKCWDLYNLKAQEKELMVKLSLEESMRVTGNPVLLDVLVHNIISNAVRYTRHGGTVTIECAESYFRVTNSGDPLEHPEKIFDRFHREVRTTPGTGLGLSIVKKICEVSGYQVFYSHTSSGHQFKISFVPGECLSSRK